MASIRATFRSTLDRMNEDPNFIYSFATPPVFEWVKKVEPEMFEKIKQRVAQGRWELSEGWWVQPDCYSACGELRTVIKADYSFNSSLLSLYYTFYEDENYFDLRYRVNWNEKHSVLKLESKIISNKTKAAVPYGIIGREESAADVPMSDYVCADGISYICDSIFAYSSADNKLGLTVLRSPIYGDLRIRDIDYDEDYDILSQGISEGKIRISREEYSPDITDSFLNPPVIICESNHEGTLPAEKSFVSVDNKSVSVSAVNKCEYDFGDIVRLFEHSGKEQNMNLSYFGTKYAFQLAPFEIKTVKIENGLAVEYYMTEDEPYTTLG